jgi:protein-S-isoprenylcysteine O-methyltransferase Ste14
VELRWAVFAVTLAAVLGYLALLAVTLARPGFRVWPPPGRQSWQYRLTWGLTAAVAVGTVATDWLDAGRAGWERWSRYPVGVSLMLAGFGFGLWGLLSLGGPRTAGLAGGLVTGGAFAYSRNPQYVGDIVGLAGFAVVCDSGLAYALWAAEAAVFVMLPWVEEPWLAERFGLAYTDYCRRAPRYLSLDRPARLSDA